VTGATEEKQKETKKKIKKKKKGNGMFWLGYLQHKPGHQNNIVGTRTLERHVWGGAKKSSRWGPNRDETKNAQGDFRGHAKLIHTYGTSWKEGQT